MRDGGSSPVAVGLRRGFAFLVLAGLLVMGLVLDGGLGTRHQEGSWVPVGEPAPERLAVTSPGTLSASWYCAEGTSNEGGRADETVSIANAGEIPLDAVITVMRGDEPAVRKPVEVPARSRTEVRVADVVQTEEPGVVVEVFGGDAGVEHILRGAGDVEAVPCARRAATQWLFAGGSTIKEAGDVLALFNPFDDDAIVDMSFFTEEGVVEPELLQDFVVPGRSRVSVPVHEHVLRKQVVAAEIVARTGRIVAERSIQFDGTTERRGLEVYLGANHVAEVWTFPEGVVIDGVLEDVWIFNPGRSDTDVEIQPEVDGEAVLEPQTIPVPNRSAVSFRMNDVVPANTGHSLRVTATGEEDVVVAQQVLSVPGAARVGSSVVPGITGAARRWMLPAGSADDVTDEWIVVSNSGTTEATLTISVLAGGVLLVPEGLADLKIAPLERGSFRLGDALKRTDLPVVVEADRPVEVVRGLFEAGGVSYSAGIPFPEP